MARTVKQEEHAAKRTEILDAAMALVFTKGYEQMTIQDILGGLGISKGAFYHYFDSKAALLEAFIEQIRSVTEASLLPLVRDPRLSAVEKLQGFFATFDRLRTNDKDRVLGLGLVWYDDVNALVRQKVEDAVRAHRAPLVTEIVHQGVREGVFSTSHPDESGDVVMSLVQGMAAMHAKLLLQRPPAPDERRCAERIAQTHAAYMDAIERVLAAPPGSLHRVDAKTVRTWVRAVRRRMETQ